MSKRWYGGVTIVLRDPDEVVRAWEASETEGGLAWCHNSHWEEERFAPWSRVVEITNNDSRDRVLRRGG